MIKYLSPFNAQTLAAGNTLAYTVPASTVAQLRALTFHNTGVANVSVEVYLVPSAVATVDAAQRLVKKTLAQNDSYLCPEVINQVLPAGMKVYVVGQGANAMLSVAEQPV